MGYYVRMIFSPPPIPDIEYPFAAKLIPHFKMAISSAFEFSYYRGVYDGFVAGMVICILMIPVLIMPSVRGMLSGLAEKRREK